MEKLTIKSIYDQQRAREGELGSDQIRTVTVNALVDTGASFVGLHQKNIDQLGLIPIHEMKFRTGNGILSSFQYFGASMELMDRRCTQEVFVIPDEVPPIIGVLLLEALDLMVDPVSQSLRGRHGDQPLYYFLHAVPV